MTERESPASPGTTATPALSAASITAGYGRARALDDVSIDVSAGEVVGILGANGAGKSTLLKAMAGMVTPASGTVRLFGRDVTRVDAWRRARAGLGFVAEGGHVFESMTVSENLELAALARGPLPREWPTVLESCFDWFPVLGEKRALPAGALSGGQRQMLAVARGFAARPKVLLLDEPAVGLSVRIVRELAGIITELAGRGTAIVLTDQNPDLLRRAAKVCHVMAHGRITWTGTADDLQSSREARDAAIGMGITQ